MDGDVVVIGAGIHGAGVAQAAAAAGYRTRVLEQYGAAALATSSKSTKLIHGGLRYLENGQFRLVHECLRERRYLLQNAPRLVQLAAFHIPVYADTRRRPWKIGLGLSLYRLLGGGRFTIVPAGAREQLDGLRTEGLQTVFRYQDARTDDAALTRAVLRSACELGAEIRYHCRFEQARCNSRGVVIRYRHNGSLEEIEAAVMVNATGPWVNSILGTVEPAPRRLAVDLVQGTHLILPGSLHRGMYYLEAPQDRRAVFVTPWKGRILLGTTETLFHGDPATVKPLPQEIDYLLEVYNHYFRPPLSRTRVLEAFAGLRVLPRGSGSAFRRPRDTLLHRDTDHCPRLLSLYGGKLTSYRATAERVVEKLRPLLPPRRRIADTRTLALPDNEKEAG